MVYAYLIIAVSFEVVGTTFLKASAGFTKLWPSLACGAAYAGAFYFLALTLRTMPVGIAYALWSGLGIILISGLGFVIFGERLDLPAVIGLGLIIAGIITINVFSSSVGH